MNFQNNCDCYTVFKQLHLMLNAKKYYSKDDAIDMIKTEINFVKKLKNVLQNDATFLSYLDVVEKDLRGIYESINYANFLNWHPSKKDKKLLGELTNLKLKLIR